MKHFAGATFTLAMAGLLLTNSANATTFFLQAASGHPHQSAGTDLWNNEWTTNNWFIIDGRSIKENLNGILGWDIPIPIDAASATWTVQGFGNIADAALVTRACSFDSNGNFSSCGAATTTAFSSSVVVPSNGTAYSQTTFSCVGICTVPILYHIRASH